MAIFGTAGDLEYAALVAENTFINRIQLEIERVMSERRLKQTDLARLLGVSEARVSQILGGNGKNLQARTIAKIAFVLGLEAEFGLQKPGVSAKRSASEERKSRNQQAAFDILSECLNVSNIYNDNFWTDESRINDDELVAA